MNKKTIETNARNNVFNDNVANICQVSSKKNIFSTTRILKIASKDSPSSPSQQQDIKNKMNEGNLNAPWVAMKLRWFQMMFAKSCRWCSLLSLLLWSVFYTESLVFVIVIVAWRVYVVMLLVKYPVILQNRVVLL